MDTNKKLSVAIIGGGIAGLRAARRLEEAGINYKLYEGSNRIGGRVYPFKYDDGYLQYGAEYVNGIKNEIYAIVESEKLLQERTEDLYLFEKGVTTIVNRNIVDEKILITWREFVENVDLKIKMESEDKRIWSNSVEQCVNSYFADFLKDKGTEEIDTFRALFKIYKNYFQTEWSSPINELAMQNLSAWNDETDNDDSAILNKFGFYTILQKFQDGIDLSRIELNSKIVNINFQDEKVQLRLSNGTVKQHDHVIVTCSLGYLKKNMNQLFTPNLGDRQQIAIQNMGFGNNMKIFIEYDHRWWPDDVSSILISNSENEKNLSDNLIVFQPSSWAKNVLIAWIAGDGPLQVLKLSDVQLSVVIKRHLEVNLKQDIPDSINIYRHSWIKDEFACGSYSYFTPNCGLNQTNIIKDIREPVYRGDRPIICFAGEHTDEQMYQTTVGASRSGLREANRILSYYNLF